MKRLPLTTIDDAYPLDGTISEMGATCRLSRPAQFPEHSRYLSHMHVPASKRGQGLASALLQEVCWRADCRGVSLALTARAYDEGGLSDADLVEWYGRHGFRDVDGVMIRKPRA